MPLYEYECRQCHRRTEKIQKFSDPELTVCPHCGGPLERTITAPAFHFAGGGWYKDLYSSAKPAAEGGGDTAPAAASGADAGASKGGDSGAAKSGGESAASSPGNASGGSGGTPAAAPSAAPTTPSAPSTASKN